MSNRIQYAVLGVALLLIAVAAMACANESGPAGQTSQDTPEWCKEFTDDPTFQPDRAGWCYRLTGIVVTVLEETSNLTIMEVDYGEPGFIEVALQPECSVWEPGDSFSETVRLTSLGPVFRC